MNLQKNQKYITENMFPKVKVTFIRYREYCNKVQKHVIELIYMLICGPEISQIKWEDFEFSAGFY